MPVRNVTVFSTSEGQVNSLAFKQLLEPLYTPCYLSRRKSSAREMFSSEVRLGASPASRSWASRPAAFRGLPSGNT